MRFRRALLLLLSISFLPVLALASEGQVRIGFLSGDVQVRDPESGEWATASVNTPLDEGDELWVPDDGRAELVIDGTSYVRLDHDTSLGILTLDSDSMQFYISLGRAYVHFDPDGKKILQVDTPETSTRAFQRASFDLYTADGLTDSSAYKGSVQVENEAGSTRLNAGNMLSLGKDTDAEAAPIGRADEWERWNKARDERLVSRGESTRYLPTELQPYSHDLDDYGRWVQVPDYGYVWTPTLTVGVEWAPYRHGRWIWRGGDYVWVAYEPWGWAPFHYGRWYFAARIGWCWVPPVRGAVIWGPGYVGWVRTPDYVAWVPLAPRETYYGYGDYGPNSINVRNVTNIQVTNVYVNVRVTNAVTVVKHDSFASGWDKPLKIKQEAITKDIFTPQHFVGGRPPIKPVKTSFMPVVKEVPPEKRPPPKVEGYFLGEVRKNRPLVKKPDESSWSRGFKPKELKLKALQAPKPIRAKPHAAPPPDRALTVPPPPGKPAVPSPAPRPPEGKPESKPEGFRGGFQQGGRPGGKIEDRRLEGRQPEAPTPEPTRPLPQMESRPPQKPSREPGQGVGEKGPGPRPGEIRPPERGEPAGVPPGQRKRFEEEAPAGRPAEVRPPEREEPVGVPPGQRKRFEEGAPAGRPAEVRPPEKGVPTGLPPGQRKRAEEAAPAAPGKGRPEREAVPSSPVREPGQPGRPLEAGRPAPQGPAAVPSIRPGGTPQLIPPGPGQGQGQGQVPGQVPGKGQGKGQDEEILFGPDGRPLPPPEEGRPGWNR